MKKYVAARAGMLAIVFALFSLQIFSQNIWFNEIHYDNAGTDAGEFIEIILQDAGNYNLSDFTISLYNGSNGLVYTSPDPTLTLDQYTFDGEDGRFSIFHYDYSVNGIQNGSPDGMCLDYQGTVIQFLSYEGSMLGVDGPAAGLTSTDIGVSESSSTPLGQSLQLEGAGTVYADFTGWAGPIEATKGAVNTNQTLIQPPPITPLSDWAIVLGVVLIGLFAFFRIRRNA